MTVLFIVTVSIVLIFSFVVVFGAPFLPTLRAQTIQALDLLDLTHGQTLLELGSGDGRILREAARRGIHATGYELNPILVVWSVLINWKYRPLITVHWANYWHQQLPVTDGIYVFLLDKYMIKLDTKINNELKPSNPKKPIKLVSFGFQVPGKKPVKEKNGLYLYSY